MTTENIIDITKKIDKHDINSCYCSIPMDILDTDSGIVCMNCGLCKDVNFSREEEHIQYDSTTKNLQRSGFARNDLYSDSYNLSLTCSDKFYAKRLKWYSMTYEDRVIMTLSNNLTEINTKLFLPGYIITETLYVFKEIFHWKNNDGTKTIFKCSNKKGIVSVALYFTCLKNNVKVLQDDICKAYDIRPSVFEKYVKILSERLKNVKIYSVPDETLIEKYCERLGVSNDIKKKALKILIECNVMELNNEFRQTSKLAGVIYFILQETKNTQYTRDDIKKVCNVNFNTYKKVYNNLCDNKIKIFNSIKNKNKK